jgi:site-specific DNA recombinase
LDTPASPFRVGAYARVSTLNQVYEHDSSVDTQLARIRSRAAYESEQAKHSGTRTWVITQEYREEGRSGKDIDRPALQRLLADVRAGMLDAICVTKIDRITRSLIDFYELWHTFEQHHVEFVSLGDSFETASATGRAMLKLTLVFAELERERTSERTREKIDMRRRAGLWFGGVPPLGYVSHPTEKTTIMVEDESKDLVRLIFDKFLELGSARAVTRYLAQRGFKSPKRKTQRGTTRGGKMLTVQSVLQILTNSTYIASRDRGDGTYIDCSWPPIIENELFDRVQSKLKINSEKRPRGRESVDHVFLLEGILRCGSCGSAMVRSVGTGRSRAYFYYRCSRRHKTAGQGCTLRDVPAKALESFVLDQVSAYSVDADALRRSVSEANVGRDTTLAAIVAELGEVDSAILQKRKQITKVLDVLESDENDDGLSTLRGRLKSREAELGQLSERRIELQNRRDTLQREVLEMATVAGTFTQLPHLFEEARRQNALLELRDLLRAVVDVVEWRQDESSQKKGEAFIQLFPLPNLLTPSGVNQDANGSLGCHEWLPK